MSDFEEVVYLQDNTGAIYKSTKFLSDLVAKNGGGPWQLTRCEDQGAAQAMWELANE